MKLYDQHKRIIILEDLPFAKGGQGSIHTVKSPKAKSLEVAKIYLTQKKASEVEKRIDFMIKNNPFSNAQQMIKESFTWPISPLYNDKGGFVGFTMKKINDSKTLWKLTVPKGFKEIAWEKFNIRQKDSYNKRLKIAYNLCQALDVLDKSNQFRVVDLKPENIMITKQAHIRVIDCDSFQISNNSNVLFHAEAATLEYCPPEFHNGKLDFRKMDVSENWDYFSVAVIIYQILFCLHPYSGSHPKYNSKVELIKNGVFAHGSKKNEFITIPAAHSKFKALLGKPIQALFMDAFESGHNNPDLRPSFDIWKQAILKEIYRLNNIPVTTHILKPKVKPKKTKQNRYPKKAAHRKNTPVFGAVVHQYSVNNGTYSAKIEWDVSNVKAVYINNKQVGLKGSIKVPLLNRVYTLLLIDKNGNSKSFQKKIKTPSNISLRQVTGLKKADLKKHKVIRLNAISRKFNNNLVKIHDLSSVNYPRQKMEHPKVTDTKVTKLNKPILTKTLGKTIKTFYKAAALAILFASNIDLLNLKHLL